MRSVFRALVCFLALILPATSTILRAETPLGGTLPPGVTILTSTDSYRVTSPLVIPSGAELVIEAGTVLRFDPGTGIRVEGSLVARGTDDSPIIFTSSSAAAAPADWGFPLGPGDVANGIAFVDAVDAVLDAADQYQSGSVIEHAVIEYGTGISIVRSAPLIRNNLLRFNRPHGSAVVFFNGNAPTGAGDQPLIAGNRIEDSSQYGFNVQQGTVRFERNLVLRTRGGFVGGVGGTIIENTIACNGSPVFGLVDRAVLFAFGNPATIQGNSFIENTPYDVAVRFDVTELDLSHNYWGTTDASAIAARIFDGGESPGLAVVDADPPLSAAVPAAPVAPPCAAAPVAVNDEYTTAQGNTLTVAAPGVLANDTVSAGASVEFVTVPAGGLTNTGDGGFTFTPDPSFTGVELFQYVIHSPAGDSNVATVQVTVSAASIPDVQDDAFVVDQDTTLLVEAVGLRGNDATSPDWSVEFVTLPQGELINLDGTGAFSYTPPSGFVGTITFNYVLRFGASLVSDTATVTVTVRDTAAPVISHIAADPPLLWPANHKMVPVAIAINAADNSGLTPTCRIIEVTSNEPADSRGDGSTGVDRVVTGALTVDLRAERSGKGDGRAYAVTISCEDAAGNKATGQLRVDVPHNR
jgi:hypothetical protein